MCQEFFKNLIDNSQNPLYNMGMNSEMKKAMSESIRGFRLPRYSEIPDVGLYLEQTAKYINGYLSPLGCVEITPSMVSNYVKKGLIANPVKKQYCAEHIAYLFFIALAKNLISMENIALMIEMQRRSYTVPVAYDYLCNEFENMLYYIFDLKDTLDVVGETESEQKNLLYSLIFSCAHVIYMNSWFERIREDERTAGKAAVSDGSEQ